MSLSTTRFGSTSARINENEGILTFRLSLLTAAPGQTPDSHPFNLNDLANRQLFPRLLKQLYGFEVA